MQKELKLAKATAGAYESNIGSIRAFEKAGFTIESVRPAHCLVNGVREGLVLMGRIL
jgi:ribosomal-protein-alanine N-acetyltransferase